MVLVDLVLVMQEVTVVRSRWFRSAAVATGARAQPAAGVSPAHADRARQWALPESEPAELPLAPGDPATGRPSDYPQRAPRRLG